MADGRSQMILAGARRTRNTLPIVITMMWSSHPLFRHLLMCDPPTHTSLRAAIAGEFNVRRIVALAPSIEQTVRRLLDALATQTHVDLLDSFAVPLSFNVIGTLILKIQIERFWRQRILICHVR